ncbi:hypothetical protein FRUB_00322 [Fimbriiglobus ruber]|uniref:Uncharacterized protein n=1 Tax=Fimbriiglobus ruber TaxID=1908690 RepID=A0A225E070_9BACT|nr:hypothetical protein FRUB_00322 [Fimbriiglobus ruber]
MRLVTSTVTGLDPMYWADQTLLTELEGNCAIWFKRDVPV